MPVRRVLLLSIPATQRFSQNFRMSTISCSVCSTKPDHLERAFGSKRIEHALGVDEKINDLLWAAPNCECSPDSAMSRNGREQDLCRKNDSQKSYGRAETTTTWVEIGVLPFWATTTKYSPAFPAL
jgi:hypothetical protein